MNTFVEFMRMDGHGVYVWLSYGLTAAVLLANWTVPRRRLRALLGRVQGGGRS